MATELKSRAEDVTLTRYYGGAERGTCVQVTVGSGLNTQYVSLTRAQAAALADDLMEYAAGCEVENLE